MKHFAENKPVLFSCCVFAYTVALLIGASVVASFLPFQDQMYADMVREMLVLCGAVAALFAANTVDVLKRSHGSFWRGIRSGLYFVIISFQAFIAYLLMMSMWDIFDQVGVADQYRIMGFDFGGYALQPIGHILAFLLTMAMVGMAEEYLFRGVIAERLIRRFGATRKGVVFSAFLSGAMFGVLHLINARGTSLLSASIQALVATCIGTAFGVIYYSSRSIWALVLIHALNDFAVLAVAGGGLFGIPGQGGDIVAAMNYGVTNLVALVPYAVMLPILLRKGNLDHIRKNYGFEV